MSEKFTGESRMASTIAGEMRSFCCLGMSLDLLSRQNKSLSPASGKTGSLAFR
jgi:hypothetical protein